MASVGLHVLVVDDDELNRVLVERVLAARGIEVETSPNGFAALAEGRSNDFRRHWLGTHFFNPPRYLRLLELIPTADTAKSALKSSNRWATPAGAKTKSPGPMWGSRFPSITKAAVP